jgi:hypothetical protein
VISRFPFPFSWNFSHENPSTGVDCGCILFESAAAHIIEEHIGAGVGA